MKYWQYFALIFSLGIVIPEQGRSVPTTEQPTTLTANAVGQWNFVPPPPPVDLGIPGDRTGAGRRGCMGNSSNSTIRAKQLTALVPVTKTHSANIVWGLTTTTHPTFWFYVPYRANDVHSAKFVLRTADHQLVYQTKVTLPVNHGVISLSLPQSVAALAVGKPYHWYFNIYCAERKPPTAVVHGWVQRTAITSTLETQLAQATPQTRAEIYFANGIWYDAVTTIANLHYRNPKDATLMQNWTQVLKFVGLDAIASVPIASCCNPIQQVRNKL